MVFTNQPRMYNMNPFTLLKQLKKKNHTKYIEQWFSRPLDIRQWWTVTPKSQKRNEVSPWLFQLTPLRKSPGHSIAHIEKPGHEAVLQKFPKSQESKTKQLEFVLQSTKESCRERQLWKPAENPPWVFNICA